MSNASDIFEAFYSKMLLRDIAGKVIPGLAFIISTSIMLFSFSDVITFSKEMNVIGWLVIFGFSWIVAFAIQAFAETRNLILYYPSSLSREQWYEKLIYFYEFASDQEKQNFERFVVIKEACGNSYVSFLLSFLILVIYLLVKFITNGLNYLNLPEKSNVAVVLFILFPFVIYWLRKMHFYHVERQNNFVNAAIKKHENKG